MLNKSCEISLNLLLSGDEKIKEKLLMLIDSMPAEFKEAISHSKKSGNVESNGTLWSFSNTEEDFGIIVGEKKQTNKEYVSLYLRKLDAHRIRNMSKTNDYEYIGYVTFFLNDGKHRNRQLNYDCYLERKNEEYYVRLKGRLNSLEKETKELIEKCGFTDLAQSVFNKRVVKVNINDILSRSTGRK